MTRNIFVLGMTDLQRQELETTRSAEDCRFHGLLDYEQLVQDTDYDLEVLLDRARHQLDTFPGSVDAIVCHWDFPSSVIGPILSAERDLPAPTLESLLACEHKYWSRLAQREVVPDVVPAFCPFDPFADDVRAQIALDFPFWVKPVKAHSSELGFAIHDEDELARAVEQIRDEIGEVGDAFDQALARVTVPEEVGSVGGNSCLAEQIVTGIQAAPEASVYQGAFHAHGLIDMHKDEDGTSITRIDYPGASVPGDVQDRMVEVSRRLLEHVGFDNGACNVEFMWDPDADRLWLIEVNTRISQSHSELFILVDGASNHEVVIDIALGREPRMPHREGPYAVAAKCAIFHDRDGIVRRVPSAQDKEAVARRFPGARVTLVVQEGDQLSELPHQDSYRYLWGNVYLGAHDRDELQQRYDEVVAMLPIAFDPAP
ncbi:ATP-grasp domain-containing protein [Ornithinimicrobium cavernae]|uniref:ATP-grasp domain-containing protein n=1 Tax=Ornithinimicrobium cavernae TaxID=2666047 RepID=UPI000D68F752|nr:ATP-grasp domain-containing protein [Ornithinimicrobium cavernae]